MSMYPILSGTLSGASTNITNIPQTFSHLQLRLFMRSTAVATTAVASLQFNSDIFANNYNGHNFSGDGSTVSATTLGTNTFIPLPAVPAASAASNLYGGLIIDILDYRSTAKTKTVRILGGYDANGTGLAAIRSAVWFKTPEAITTINLAITTGFDANSRWQLYGLATSNMTGV